MTTLAHDQLVIGFGGNTGPVQTTFELAREALRRLGDIRSAPLYRSAPIGPEQPEFLNTAVCITCSGVTPRELIAAIRKTEQLLGRNRAGETRWGPRPIDLDVLLWGTRTINTPDLEVPHPRLTHRRFVIEPLRDLFGPNLVVSGRTLAELAREVDTQYVETIAESW